MQNPKQARGRPTRYRAEYAEQAYKLCLLGATDAEMADFFNVRVTTIDNWKRRHREFMGSITRGKDQADADVAQKLLERAMGYSHPEEKIFQNGGEIIRAQTTKHYPPDTQAASLWLRNRQPSKWRDKVDHEHAGPGGGPIPVAHLTDEELLAIAARTKDGDRSD